MAFIRITDTGVYFFPNRVPGQALAADRQEALRRLFQQVTAFSEGYGAAVELVEGILSSVLWEHALSSDDGPTDTDTDPSGTAHRAHVAAQVDTHGSHHTSATPNAAAVTDGDGRGAGGAEPSESGALAAGASVQVGEGLDSQAEPNQFETAPSTLPRRVSGSGHASPSAHATDGASAGEAPTHAATATVLEPPGRTPPT